MLNYTLYRCDKNLIQESKEFFNNKYLKKLKNENIVSRYLVIRLMKNYTHSNVRFLETFQNGAPKPIEDMYWSISHKTISNTIYVGATIDFKPIGIDIEYIKPRSKELLDIFSLEEYKIFGKKTWLNFYKIWTSKEALIKKLNLTLNNIENICFIDETHINYLDIIYKVRINKTKKLLYAIV